MPYGTGKQLPIQDALKGVEHLATPKPKRFGWGVVEYLTPERDKKWRYHNTDIVTLKPNGDIILNSGGFRTYTTKEKTNIILQHIASLTMADRRWSVYQANGLWTVSNSEGLHIPYFDGLNLSKAQDPKTQANANKAQQSQIKLRKAILKYAKLYTADTVLPNGKPTEGDCWLCCGIAPQEKGHLLSHIKEGYVMTALAVNALKANGYDPRYALTHSRPTTQHSVAKYLYRALGV